MRKKTCDDCFDKDGKLSTMTLYTNVKNHKNCFWFCSVCAREVALPSNSRKKALRKRGKKFGRNKFLMDHDI